MKKNTPRIFVADDDNAIVEVIAMMLEDEGYIVEATVDGKEIYEIQDDYPDLFLLDIWMSGIDGGELCRHLKNQTQTKDIPVLLISANRDTPTIAEEVGADGFLMKPFEIDELLSAVQENLE